MPFQRWTNPFVQAKPVESLRQVQYDMAMNLVAELTHLKSREHLSHTLIYDLLLRWWESLRQSPFLHLILRSSLIRHVTLMIEWISENDMGIPAKAEMGRLYKNKQPETNCSETVSQTSVELVSGIPYGMLWWFKQQRTMVAVFLSILESYLYLYFPLK